MLAWLKRKINWRVKAHRLVLETLKTGPTNSVTIRQILLNNGIRFSKNGFRKYMNKIEGAGIVEHFYKPHIYRRPPTIITENWYRLK